LNNLRVLYDGLDFQSVLFSDRFSALHLKSLQERGNLRGVINLTDCLADLFLERFGDSAELVADILQLVHQVGAIALLLVLYMCPLVHYPKRGLLEILSALIADVGNP
jgi:hypothetical protein